MTSDCQASYNDKWLLGVIHDKWLPDVIHEKWLLRVIQWPVTVRSHTMTSYGHTSYNDKWLSQVIQWQVTVRSHTMPSYCQTSSNDNDYETKLLMAVVSQQPTESPPRGLLPIASSLYSSQASETGMTGSSSSRSPAGRVIRPVCPSQHVPISSQSLRQVEHCVSNWQSTSLLLPVPCSTSRQACQYWYTRVCDRTSRR